MPSTIDCEFNFSLLQKSLPWEIDRTFWIPGLWSGTTAKSSSMMTRKLILELLYCGKLHGEGKTEPAADRSDKWHPNEEPLVTHLQAWLGPLNEADPLGSSSTQAPSGPSAALGPSISAMTISEAIVLGAMMVRTCLSGKPSAVLDGVRGAPRSAESPPAATSGEQLEHDASRKSWKGVGTLTLVPATAVASTPTKNRSKKRYCGDCDVGYSEDGGFSEVEVYILLYLSWLSDLCRRASPFSSFAFSHFVRLDALGPVCGRAVWEEGVSDECIPPLAPAHMEREAPFPWEEMGGWVQDPTNNPRLGHTSMLGRGGWVVRRSWCLELPPIYPLDTFMMSLTCSDMYGWV
ncbi:hypothetical protein C8J56DRAFT_900734 [Mycena floridula]|nr:hypothetical protein C8J56DRAFT_900734 [Mycena floridula]